MTPVQQVNPGKPVPVTPVLTIGTRGSPLALAQAQETRQRLLLAHPALREAEIVVRVIKTTGDRIQDRSLAERSEEHTSELQSLMRISYAVFCLKKKNKKKAQHTKPRLRTTHTINKA